MVGGFLLVLLSRLVSQSWFQVGKKLVWMRDVLMVFKQYIEGLSNFKCEMLLVF